ncbi:MAG: ATP synthase F1 subunit gamma [Candidatus Neomarinimicrobiota bacterium]
MANLKTIRQRINGVRGVSQVTKAVKMVAAARLRKSQNRIEQARPYAFRINSVLESLLPNIERGLNRLLEVRPVENLGFVTITADRGLCAGFNANIINRATEIMGHYDRNRIKLICVGKKGSEYFRKRGWNVIGDYVGFWRELSFSDAVDIVESITALYMRHDLDQVLVIFNEFKNVLEQRVVPLEFLPLELEEWEVGEIPGEYLGETPPSGKEYLFEPSIEVVVNSLVPRHLNVQMWRYLLESDAAEQAARMTAMDNATENALEMITDLTLELNKARQAAITTEILEVVGGANALKY